METATCIKCGVDKSVDNFAFCYGKNGTPYRRHTCRACLRVRHYERLARDPKYLETIKATQKRCKERYNSDEKYREERREACRGHVRAKRCKRCKERLPVESFETVKVMNDTVIRRQICVGCSDAALKASQEREELAKHLASCPVERKRRSVAMEEKRFAYHLRARYGLSIDEYNTLFEDQKGVCAICGEVERKRFRGKITRLAVDHDHATGKVRGLLCFDCNGALGKFRDSESNLKSAVHYLEKHRRQHI